MDGSLRSAVNLLRDPNLVWSQDLESIREPLADLLDLIGQLPRTFIDEPAQRIAQALTEDR